MAGRINCHAAGKCAVQPSIQLGFDNAPGEFSEIDAYFGEMCTTEGNVGRARRGLFALPLKDLDGPWPLGRLRVPKSSRGAS